MRSVFKCPLSLLKPINLVTSIFFFCCCLHWIHIYICAWHACFVHTSAIHVKCVFLCCERVAELRIFGLHAMRIRSIRSQFLASGSGVCEFRLWLIKYVEMVTKAILSNSTVILVWFWLLINIQFVFEVTKTNAYHAKDSLRSVYEYWTELTVRCLVRLFYDKIALWSPQEAYSLRTIVNQPWATQSAHNGLPIFQ